MVQLQMVFVGSEVKSWQERSSKNRAVAGAAPT